MKYVRAVRKNSQSLQCYENCKLHDGKDKLPFKVTVVKNLEKIDEKLSR